MSINKSDIRKMIREEIRNVLSEGRRQISDAETISPEELMRGAADDAKKLAKIGVQVKPKKSSFTGSPNWLVGKHGPHTVQIKRYNKPSQYGINQGRISVLYIADKKQGTVLANYDRGWDVKPSTPEAKKLVDQIVGALK